MWGAWSGRTGSTLSSDESPSGVLPVRSIENGDRKRIYVDAFNAAKVYNPFAWIDPRTTERVNPAVLAEVMIGRLCVELIGSQIVLPFDDAKTFSSRSVPERPDLAAYGASTAHGSRNLAIQFKGDATAVASALVCLMFTHGDLDLSMWNASLDAGLCGLT